MHADFWHQKWQEAKQGFQQEKINSRLMKFWSALDVPQESRVFVPLCGKSLDMIWLKDQGHMVLGCELSQKAGESFFKENALSYSQNESGNFVSLKSEGIEILAGDFFDLSAEHLQGTTGVYDRAALIALPPEMRQQYVDHFRNILPNGCKLLLISMEYDESKMKGPPFSVPESEVRDLFSEGFSISIVSQSGGPDIVGNLKERGLDTLDESVYLIEKTI